MSAGQRLVTAAPGRGAGSPRVVLVAEHRLVSEAIRVALSSRGYDMDPRPWPSSKRDPSSRRTTAVHERLGAGLVVSELDDPRRLADVTSLVGSVPLRWLVLAGAAEGPHWGALVQAGAVGLLPSSVALDRLAATLDAVIAGREVIDPVTRARLVHAWSQSAEQRRRSVELVARLTPRERQVLRLLYEGLPVATIAREAGAAEQTVRSQVKAILRKLEVRSQIAAVAVYGQALESGVDV